MEYIIRDICGLALLIAGVIGVVRFKAVSPVYQPFFYFVWLGCANELLSTYLIYTHHYTTVNNNLYVLAASLLLLWFFKSLEVFRKGSPLFWFLVCSFIGVWLYETFIYGSIHRISSYFRIYFSFAIVLLSISAINKLLITSTSKIHYNSVFLICTGFIIFFTYKVLIETFWLYGLGRSGDFPRMVYRILIYIIFFVNLIYALAALWIPKQRPSILLSSSPA